MCRDLHRLEAAGDGTSVLGEVLFDDGQLESREDRFLGLTFEQKLERGLEQPFGRRAPIGLGFGLIATRACFRITVLPLTCAASNALANPEKQPIRSRPRSQFVDVCRID
jgi:hypothetical protein